MSEAIHDADVIETMIASIAALFLVAAEPEEPRYANLEVLTALEGEAGMVLARRIRERAAVVLRAGAVLPARGEGDPTILVSVEPSNGEEPGYAYHIELERGGQAIAPPVEGRCDLCTEGELVATIEVDLGSAIQDLPAVAPPPPITKPPEQAPDVRQEDRRLGGKGIAGAVLLAAGAAALATGIGLAAAPPKADPEDPRFDLTTRPAGYALLGAGAATAILGAVLIGVDARQRRRTAMRFGGFAFAF